MNVTCYVIAPHNEDMNKPSSINSVFLLQTMLIYIVREVASLFSCSLDSEIRNYSKDQKYNVKMAKSQY